MDPPPPPPPYMSCVRTHSSSCHKTEEAMLGWNLASIIPWLYSALTEDVYEYLGSRRNLYELVLLTRYHKYTCTGLLYGMLTARGGKSFVQQPYITSLFAALHLFAPPLPPNLPQATPSNCGSAMKILLQPSVHRTAPPASNCFTCL